MKIIHLADTHLGFRQFSQKLDPVRKLNQRECDVYDVWHRAIDIAIERNVDAVIHAGDLFDSPRPSHRALTEAIDGFTRLRDAGIPVVAIAGNHSTPRFRSGGSVFEVLERFGVLAAWRAPQTFRLGDAAFHAVPHESDAEQLKTDIHALEPDSSAAVNVLMLHAGLEAVPSSGYGEVNAMNVSQELLVDAPFDYIAMGHLHRFQVPQVNAIYPGSLERLDFADLAGVKAVLEIDLGVPAGAPGFVTHHPLSTRPMIDLSIDCIECDADVVLTKIGDAAEGEELGGAVVRVRLEEIQRDVWNALDFDAVDDVFHGSLHRSVQQGRTGVAPSSATPEHAELQFHTWARERVPAGLDPERVIAIAKTHLDDATTAEAEEAAE